MPLGWFGLNYQTTTNHPRLCDSFNMNILLNENAECCHSFPTKLVPSDFLIYPQNRFKCK